MTLEISTLELSRLSRGSASRHCLGKAFPRQRHCLEALPRESLEISRVEISTLEISDLEISTLEISTLEISTLELSRLSRGTRSGHVGCALTSDLTFWL